MADSTFTNTDLAEALAGLETLENVFRGLKSTGAIVRVLQGALQRVNELTAAADKRQAEITAAVDDIYATAKSAAKAEADKIAADAKATGQAAIAAANAQAAEKRREVAALDAEANGLHDKIAALKAQLGDMQAHVAKILAPAP